MAAYMTIKSRYSSWKDLYLSKKKGTKGFPKETIKLEELTTSGPSPTFVGDRYAFFRAIDFFEGESFLLLPAGGNQVSIVHNCFKANVEEIGLSIFGILGSRRTSPFKRINVGQAVKRQATPRVTMSQERKEAWAPPSEDLAKCKSANDFRDSTDEPGGKGHSAAALREYPHACFVHPDVFEAFGKESTIRAGDLAMRILKSPNLNLGSDPDGTHRENPEKETQLLLFLWSVENFRMSKVSLGEAPDNDDFDYMAQKIMRKLDKEESDSEGTPRRKGRPNDDQQPSSDRSSPIEIPRDASEEVGPDGDPQDSSRSTTPTKDRIKSKKPTHNAPDGSPIAKFRGRSGEKQRKERRKGRSDGPSPSRSPSDSDSDSGSESSKSEGRGKNLSRNSRSQGSRSSRSKSKASSRSEGKSPERSRSRSRTRSRSEPERGERSDSSRGGTRATERRRPRKSPHRSDPEDSSSDPKDSDDSSRSESSRSARSPKKRRKRGETMRGRGRRRKRTRRRRREPSSSDEERDLHKAMVRSLHAMTSSQLKRDEKEDKKKSMLSRLSPEGGSLFRLLSARDWNDRDPTLPALTQKILADRDSNRALGEMKSLAKRWSGRISEKGLLSFLANGYAADDIGEAPGGFSIFMFSPLGAKKSTDQKSRVLQVKSMFGSTELDEESIKYFAKNDFYLASDLSGLQEQIHTCVKLLEKLTCRNGIASEGFRHGLEMLNKYKREFLGLSEMDALFPVKFAYLLDRAFQNFVQDLGDFHDKADPIRRAKRHHRGQQIDDIDAAMSGFKTGSLSQLFLPRTLRADETAVKDSHSTTNGGSEGVGVSKQKSSKTPATTRTKVSPEGWWTTNPHPVADWAIPEGKTFGELFDPRNDTLKSNTSGWPKFKHHDPAKTTEKFLCVRYQCTGVCREKCFQSHVDPEKMPDAPKKAVGDKFKVIYG